MPFNDIPAMDAALAAGDVAAVLIEPALTNIGIVLPDAGWHAAVRAACDRNGTLLVIDETHTLCAGPGGMTARDGLEPDVVVVGKTIGGGIPAGAWGMKPELSARVRASLDWEARAAKTSTSGEWAARSPATRSRWRGSRATLSEVLTPEVYPGHDRASARDGPPGCRLPSTEFAVPWQVTQLGARAEYSFPADATARRRAKPRLPTTSPSQQYLHLHALNRGILMTPFHNI